MLAAMPAWAEGDGKSPLSTELIFRSPLRDIQDDGKDLNLKSKEKFDLATRLANIEEQLDVMLRTMEGLVKKVEKNDGRLDDVVAQIEVLGTQIAELRERQQATSIALQAADVRVTEMEAKVTKVEARLAEVTAWANDVWNKAQGVLAQAQQTLAYAQAADAAARPSGLIGGLLSLLPGLGHK